ALSYFTARHRAAPRGAAFPIHTEKRRDAAPANAAWEEAKYKTEYIEYKTCRANKQKASNQIIE
uniref:Uncharacterized protein n=1 Tax=Romanomermis culicivorax TaxID=13658 RepID=A0A915JFB8_ROMCU